jgi:hypothetical protein
MIAAAERGGREPGLIETVPAFKHDGKFFEVQIQQVKSIAEDMLRRAQPPMLDVTLIEATF